MAEYCPYCMRQSSGKYCTYCGGEIAFQGKKSHLPVGTRLIGTEAPYLLGASIGQGGFGVTYAALNCASGERVAVKEYFPVYWSGRSKNGKNVIPKSLCTSLYEKGRGKFIDEALTIKKIKYQKDLKSIVNVKDYFQANSTAYIVMEYLEGETLTQRVKRKGRLAVEELWSALRPLMKDIGAMHAQNVIHRDIAPDNIMVTKSGRWILMDFGSARSFQKTPTGKTRFIKPGFSPVEQYQQEGRQKGFTDVYSMAATIYYCLSGTTPAQSPDRLYEITNNRPDPLKKLTEFGVTIPISTEGAIWKAMAIYSSARTQSMQELCDQFYRDATAEKMTWNEKEIYGRDATAGIPLAFLPFQVVPDDRALEIRWKGKRPGGANYVLLRSINSGKHRIISRENHTSQRDQIPNNAKSVQYRLELRDANGVMIGTWESDIVDLHEWKARSAALQKLLLPILVAAAAILLAVLVVLLISII